MSCSPKWISLEEMPKGLFPSTRPAHQLQYLQPIKQPAYCWANSCNLFIWNTLFCLCRSCMSMQYVTLPICLSTSYGPCHWAISALVDIGSSTNTQPPLLKTLASVPVIEILLDFLCLLQIITHQSWHALHLGHALGWLLACLTMPTKFCALAHSR